MAPVNNISPTTQPKKITPELVKQVADKVYALWLADLKIQRERQRLAAKR